MTKHTYNIIAKVKFNDHFAIVLDTPPILEYTKISGLYGAGGLLYGTDGIFYECYRYETPFKNWEAFAGRKFDIPLHDGTIEHCYGQWWHGGHDKIEKLLGITLCSVTYSTIEKLKNCYVFSGDAADSVKFEELLDTHDGPLYGYREFEQMLKKGVI
jgi:hypothetical protein